MFDFIKYQSLGNDFILLDFLNKTNAYIETFLSNSKWTPYVRRLCNRHTGIGADGILILRHRAKKDIEVSLYNSDGSIGKKCLNGLRCVTHYLFTQKKLASPLALTMNSQPIFCERYETAQDLHISLNIGTVNYQGLHALKRPHYPVLSGHIIDAGNPHFVMLQPITLEELKRQGPDIESHSDFPDRINVEFIWESEKTPQGSPVFTMLVFERGCGLTQACGSGAAAALYALYQTGQVAALAPITIQMPGGSLLTYINENKEVIQIAPAQLSFTGNCKIEW